MPDLRFRLVSARFQNFRSIEDSRLDLAHPITTIVGENETGKTNILYALDKFNTDKRLTKLDKKQHAHGQLSLTLTFEVLGNQSELCDILGCDPQPKIRTLEIRKTENNQYFILSPKFDIEKSAAYRREADRLLREALEQAETEDADQDENEEKKPTPVPKPDRQKVINEIYFKGVLPRIRIKYYRGKDTTDLVPDKVNLTTLKAHPEKHAQVVNLLSLGGIDFESFPSNEIHKLKRASTKITERVRQFWKQEKIELDVSFSSPNVNIAVKDGLISDDVWLGPQLRSDGFQWYLGFYVHFLCELENSVHDSILLLDEPGLYLHPDAQKDLVRLLAEIAQNGNQIVYTTHSPFMVDRDHMERIRFLQKKSKGTRIDNSAWSRGGQGLLPEPIRAVLGMLISDSLFYDKRNVVVEGPSDKIYLVAVIEALEREGLGRPFDLTKVSLIPAYSATKMGTVAGFLKNEQLDVVAVADADSAGDSAVKSMKDSGVLDANQILTLASLFHGGSPRESIEDLVPKDLLIAAVNGTYSLRDASWQDISASDLPGSGYYPVVPKLNELLKSRGFDGDLDKPEIAQRVVEMMIDSGVSDAGAVRSEWQKMLDLVDLLVAALDGNA